MKCNINSLAYAALRGSLYRFDHFPRLPSHVRVRRRCVMEVVPASPLPLSSYRHASCSRLCPLSPVSFFFFIPLRIPHFPFPRISCPSNTCYGHGVRCPVSQAVCRTCLCALDPVVLCSVPVLNCTEMTSININVLLACARLVGIGQ